MIKARIGRMTLLFVCTFVVSLTGCYQRIHRAMDCYQDAACAVQLGMAEEEFVAVMLQRAAAGPLLNYPQRIERERGMYTVHLVPVELAPHDDFDDGAYTPYVFRGGRLVAMGWDYMPEGEGGDSQVLDREEEALADAEPVVLPADEHSNDFSQRGPFKWCVHEVHGGPRCQSDSCC